MITHELLPVIILWIRAILRMADGFALASLQILYTMCEQEVAGGGFVFCHVWYERRYVQVVAGDGVWSGRLGRCSL